MAHDLGRAERLAGSNLVSTVRPQDGAGLVGAEDADLSAVRPPRARLTKRQWLTAVCLASGMSVLQTAYSLGVEYNTVNTARRRLYARLGVRTRIELAVLLENRLPTPGNVG